MPATIVPVMISVAGASFVRVLTSGYGIRLYGSSSGYVGLKPATAAGSTDYTLPSSPPSADGQVLIGTTAGVLSWATVSGASPSGSGTELQYRSGASTFGAVTGSSVANGGIALVLQSASQVGVSITLASGQTANAIEVNSYGGTAGDVMYVRKNGSINVQSTDASDVSRGVYLGTGGSGIEIHRYGGDRLIAKSLGTTVATFDERSSYGIVVGSGLPITFATAGYYGFHGYSSGVVHLKDGSGTFGDLKLRSLYSVAGSATDIPVNISLASGQTANALDINSYGNTGGNLLKVSAAGNISFSGILTATSLPLDLMATGLPYSGIRIASNGMYPLVSNSCDLGYAAGGFSWKSLQLVGRVGWDSGGTVDAGVCRNAAGVLEVNNGTAGTYRDLKLRHLVATGQAYCPQQTLTDAASISWDLDTQPSAVVTLADNRTLAAPTNQKAGATYILVVKQDATGSRTLTFNAVYKFAGGTAPTLTTTANAVDILTFISDGTYMYGVCQNDLLD